MNKFLFLLLFSVSVFSQQEKDSIITAKIDTLFIAKDSIKKDVKAELFSDTDLELIDSLLIEEKFN
jgi:membrane-bound lytic murein transglycosylase D